MTPLKMPSRSLNVWLPLRPNSLQGSGFLISGTCGRHKCMRGDLGCLENDDLENNDLENDDLENNDLF